MIYHYVTAALRNIKKNKISFFINLIGLSLGLASAFIISSYILKETSYDRFHSKKDRIYRVLCDNTNVNWTSPGIPYVLKEHIDNSIPVVEKSCLVDFLYMAKVKQGDEYFPFKKLYACTPEFFSIFDCKLIAGNLDGSLRNINSLVITRKVSEEYFPNDNPIGKTLDVKVDSEIYTLIVDAVIEDFPQNSSFKFNALCNIEISVKNFESQPWVTDYKNSWQLNFNTMFLLLKEKEPSAFQTTWDQFEKNHNLTEKEVHFHLQPLTDIHLNSAHLVNDGPRGDRKQIRLFSSIAFIILIVAAFNYIILSISISKMRYKEIGVKKIVGSQNSLIRKQFFIESTLISLIAFPIAYLVAYFSTDLVNKLFNMSLDIDILKNPDQLFAFILVLLTIGLISGSYIAFYSARLNPLDIIKFKFSNQNKKVRFQYVILLFQIIVFSGLTGASFSIYKQIDFMKNADLGINLNNKLSITLDDIELNQASYQSLSQVLNNIPDVKKFTLGAFMPPQNSRGVQTVPDPNDETKRIKYEVASVSQTFFSFFEIECLQGRTFDPDYKDDSSKIVINESAVKAFGFENPVGELIREQEIIGVIKDFHAHSLHETTAPTAYSLINPKDIFEVAVEYEEGRLNLSSEKIKSELSKFMPEATTNITPIEDVIDEMYSDEKNLHNIVMYFNLFAVVIALIGIFGQSLFNVKQQIKEIGIRKVNGATNRDILLLFLRKYFLLCGLANFISWPIIYILIENWQEKFVYKSPLSIWLIMLTFLLSLSVVLATVLVNAWKAARTNPVNILKYE